MSSRRIHGVERAGNLKVQLSQLVFVLGEITLVVISICRVGCNQPIPDALDVSHGKDWILPKMGIFIV